MEPSLRKLLYAAVYFFRFLYSSVGSVGCVGLKPKKKHREEFLPTISLIKDFFIPYTLHPYTSKKNRQQ